MTEALDASDLVFVDMPGTGFGRIGGPDADKKFYGVDQHIHAFAVHPRVPVQIRPVELTQVVFGESYGTMRAAGWRLRLQRMDIDLNGVVCC